LSLEERGQAMPRKVGYRSPNAKEWKPGFLLALREVPNVLRAARAVSIPRSLAYQERVIDPEFAQAWDRALEEGQHVMVEAIESKVYDLIMNNSSFRHNVLRIFFLKSHRPEVYGDRSELKLKGSVEEPVVVQMESEGVDRVADILSVLAGCGAIPPGVGEIDPTQNDEVYTEQPLGETDGVPPTL
jgi:hypothetical protein